MKKVLILLMFLTITPFAEAQLANVLYGNISSFGLAGRTNLQMKLSILSPKNRIVNNSLVSNDPLITYSDQNGNFQYTNVIFGYYVLSAADSFSSRWPIVVYADTAGSNNLINLVNFNAAIPPPPSTNYYNIYQINQMLSSIVVGVAATNVYAYPYDGSMIIFTNSQNLTEWGFQVNTNMFPNFQQISNIVLSIGGGTLTNINFGASDNTLIITTNGIASFTARVNTNIVTTFSTATNIAISEQTIVLPGANVGIMNTTNAYGQITATISSSGGGGAATNVSLGNIDGTISVITNSAASWNISANQNAIVTHTAVLAAVPGLVTNAALANTFIGSVGMLDQDDKNDMYGFYNEISMDGLIGNVFQATAFGTRFAVAGTTNIQSLIGPNFNITGPINQNNDGILMFGSTTGLVAFPFGMTNYTVWATYIYRNTNAVQNGLAGGYAPLWVLKNTSTLSADAFSMGDFSPSFTYQENADTAFAENQNTYVDIKQTSGNSQIGFAVNVCYTRSNGVNYVWQNTHNNEWTTAAVSAPIFTNCIITDAVNQVSFGFDPILNGSLGSTMKLGSYELDAIMISSNPASSQAMVNSGYRAMSWLHKGHSFAEFAGDSRMAMGPNPVGPVDTPILTDWVTAHFAQDPNDKYLNYSRGGTYTGHLLVNNTTGLPWGWSELTNLPAAKYTSVEVDSDLGFNDKYLIAAADSTVEQNLTNIFAIPKAFGAKIGFVGIYDCSTNNSLTSMTYNYAYSNSFVNFNLFAGTNSFFDIFYPFEAFINQPELNNTAWTEDGVHFGFSADPDQTIPSRFANLWNTKGKPFFLTNSQPSTIALYQGANPVLYGNGGGLTNYSVGNLATNNANAAPTSGTPYLEWTTASGWEFGPGGSGGSGGITQLTGDVTAGPGTGSQAATVVQVGGYSAANVASGATAGNAATSANTPSTIIARDGSGNFSAGTISATFTGNGVFTSTTNTGSFTGLGATNWLGGTFTVHGETNVGTFTNNGNVGISGTLSEAGAATIAGSAAIGGPIVGLGNSNYLSGSLLVGGNQTNALAQTNLVSVGAPAGYFSSGSFSGNGGGLTNLPFFQTVSGSGFTFSTSPNANGSSNLNLTVTGGGNANTNQNTYFPTVGSTNWLGVNSFAGQINETNSQVTNNFAGGMTVGGNMVMTNNLSVLGNVTANQTFNVASAANGGTALTGGEGNLTVNGGGYGGQINFEGYGAFFFNSGAIVGTGSSNYYTGPSTFNNITNNGTLTNNGNFGISGTLTEAGAATIAGAAAIGGPVVGLGNSNYLSGALTVGGNQTNALAQTNLVSDGAPTGYFPTLYAGAANLTGTLPTGTLPASVPTSVTYNANGTSGGGASIAANVLTITAPTPSGSGSFTPLNTGGFTNTTSGQIITNQEATALNSLYVGGSDTNEGAFWAMGSLNFFQNSATFAANVLIDGPLVANGNSNVLTGSLYVGGNQTNALAQTNLVSDGAPTGYFPTLYAGTLTGNGIGITNLQGSAFAITNPAATTVTNYTVNIGAGPVMYINPGANNVCLKNILGTFGTVRVYVTGPVKILWPTNCPTFFSSLLTINNTNYVLQGTNLTCIQFDAITNLTQNASLTNVPVSWLSE